MDLSIFCADVGSLAQGNFAWSVLDLPDPRGDPSREDRSCLDALAGEIVDRLRTDVPVALGFECPMFVPIRDDPKSLGKKRKGDLLSWASGPGGTVMATGLVQVTWLFQRIRTLLGEPPEPFFQWADFRRAGRGLFLWEAFVSKDRKGADHHEDAQRAVESFRKALSDPTVENIVDEDSVLSLYGAALLRAGWAVSTSVLEQPCLVLAPKAVVARLEGEGRKFSPDQVLQEDRIEFS